MNARTQAAAGVERELGWTFRDRELLDRALTHGSVGQGANRSRTNERLEYLGDRVLALVLAEALYRRFPEADEGELTKRFHALVDSETCARLARRLGLGEALKLAPGQAKTGARDNTTILGDACEAVIAALYLDAGLEVARERVLALWAPEIEAGRRSSTENPKSALQEWAQGAGRPLPEYEVISRDGPDHAPRFVVEVRVEGTAPERAEGRSRQEAEKAAAAAMLQREGQS